MPLTLSDISPTTSTALLLQGQSGTGKTAFALQAPSPFLIDADQNVQACLHYVRHKIGPNFSLSWDSPFHDTSGNLLSADSIPLGQTYKNLLRCLKTAFENPNSTTVILDSATAVSNIIKDQIRLTYSIDPDKPLTINHWQDFIHIWEQIIGRAKRYPKMFILVAHEDSTAGGLLLPSPRARDILPTLFTDVWSFVKEQSFESGKPTLTFKIKTNGPTANGVRKNSLGLPDTIDPSWSTILPLLSKSTVDPDKQVGSDGA